MTIRLHGAFRRPTLLLGLGAFLAGCGGGTEPPPTAASLDIVGSTNGAGGRAAPGRARRRGACRER
jgi:hypothetical protein